MARRETLEGYLVELASFRAEAGDPLVRARAYRKDWLLTDNPDAAYGLVTKDGRLIALDGAARDYVAEAVRENPHESGILVQVERVERAGGMTTTAIYTTDALPSSMAGGRGGRGWQPWKGQDD